MFLQSFLVILFVALSLDNFIVLNHKGATIRDLSYRKTLMFAGIFTAANLFVLLAAFLLSSFFEGMLEMKFEFFIDIALLVMLGFYYIYSAVKYIALEERLDAGFSFYQCLQLGFLTSIDTFLVGIVMVLLGVNMKSFALMSALYTFFASVIGLRAGYSFGVWFPRLLQGIAGIMYIIFSILITLYMVV